MEVKRKIEGRKKAQMMTTTVLLMFVLMLGELFAFLILNTSYTSLSQTGSVSTGSSNLISSLQLGGRNFAAQSLQTAISTLAAYEYTPSLRRGNFVSNFSYYVSNLMISGVLPNATVAAGNTIAAQMAGATLKAYNASVLRSFGLVGGISINQTRPQIYQTSPYTLSVQYYETVRINTTYGLYTYGIPVNATLNLTGEPDLFYAEQGVLRTIGFGNLSNEVSLIGNRYAAAGSLYNFAYGTANIVIPDASSCPTYFGAANSNSIILVTNNALGITSSGCANGFGGLITDLGTVSGTPTVPYLEYPSFVNLQQMIQSGSSLLLYGPALGAFDIEPLRNAVSNGYYFASSASPSYIQRASGQMTQGSAQGIFTLGTYTRQVGEFNGASSYIETQSNVPTSTTKLTVNVWVLPFAGNGNRGIVGQGDSSGQWELKTFGLKYDFAVYASKDNSFGTVTNGTWTMLTAVYNAGSVQVYQNGQLAGTFTDGATSLPTNLPLYIGYTPSDASPLYFSGSISNVQVYNASLSSSQIANLYAEGIEGVPASGESLVSWYTLNGNANDYSGLGNTGSPTNMGYGLATSGFPTISSAQFNGASSLISTGTNKVPTGSAARSVFAWVYVPSGSSASGDVYSEGTRSGSEFAGLYVDGAYSTKYAVLFATWTTAAASSLVANTNIWNFVGYTYAGGSATSVTIYLDGHSQSVSVGSALGTVLASTNPSVIGSDAGGGISEEFQGSISDVQLYNAQLSGAQANTLYQEGRGGAPIVSANIVGWWPLNGNADDYSGQGNGGNATSVTFNQSVGSATDGLLGVDYQTLYPLPGAASCYSIITCFNASLRSVYLSSYPVASKSFLQAAQLNGTLASYINIPNSAGLDSGSQYTVSAWIKTVSTANQMIYSAWPGSGSSGYQLSLILGNADIWTGGGGTVSSGATNTIVVTSGSGWIVPANWNNNNNEIEVIGGGGSGGGGEINVNGGPAGGGGGFSEVGDVSLTPGANIPISVGLGGAGVLPGSSSVSVGNNGGNTIFGNTISGGSGILVEATGGQGGYVNNGGSGGSSIVGSGYSGGLGGSYANNRGGAAGGGGAGGPYGTGGAGGNVYSSTGGGSGGGGGNGGGSPGGNGSGSTGGAGGNNIGGTGGGSAGSGSGGNGGNGANGGGGGGGANSGSGGTGGTGGAGSDLGSGYGSGGGAGGGSAVTNAAAGGLYGGGGAGGGSNSGYYSGPGANGIIFITYVPTATTSSTVNNGNWQNVVGVFNSGGAGYLYIDGSLVISGSTSSITDSGASQIGEEAGSTPEYFNGIISNVQVYNTALSATQISALYREGIGGAPVSSANVVGWWPLNGNSNDYSGNRNDGQSDQNVAYPYVATNVSNLANIWQVLGLGVAPK